MPKAAVPVKAVPPLIAQRLAMGDPVGPGVAAAGDLGPRLKRLTRSPLLLSAGPVLGALAKMGVITLPSALQAIREMFDDERNVKAAVAAYEELKV